MSPGFTKSVAILLLLLQAWIGVARGRVMCMSVHSLGVCSRETAHATRSVPEPARVEAAPPTKKVRECGHKCSHTSAPVEQPKRPIEPRPELALAQHDPCDCCIHVATPNTDQLSQARSDVELALHEATLVVCIAIVQLLVLNTHELAARQAPPDRVRATSACALKSTRLTI